MTDTQQETTVLEPLATATFITTVARVEHIARSFVRITFAGGDLEHFQSVGPDQFLYLLLPPPGRRQLTIDAGFTWDQYRDMPEQDRPVGAYYTVRHHRPEVAELDIDVFLHAERGPASGWAATAQPGDPVALWGPRIAYAPPADTASLLLLADEAGIPALASILESLAPGTPARAFIEVSEAADEQSLLAATDADVTWLHRNGREPGGPTLLLDAVRDLDLAPTGVYAWGGGEIRAMNDLRRYLRQECGLARTATSLVGYWRHPHHTEDAQE
ncbi:MAG: siderophore-interacting protein [Dehalococcoidia bacterium]|nr:siderophore-interacting protein [Dehalococcoidia bacterium]